MKIISGDIFASGARALCNPVNCLGVSGAGLAKEFANRFPKAQREYEAAAKAGEIKPGTIFVVSVGDEARFMEAPPRFIVYVPTKRHWRDQSRMDDIDESLMCLRGWALTTPRLKSLAIPALGAGLGGLPWHVVRERIEHVMRDVSQVEIIVFEPRELGVDATR